MIGLILNDTANFELIYSDSKPPIAVTGQAGKLASYLKIGEILPSVIVSGNPILLIDISTQVPIGKNWIDAGVIRKLLPTAKGLAFNGEQAYLRLGKQNLVILDRVNSDFQLSYIPPSHFISLDINVYQYIGNVTRTL